MVKREVFMEVVCCITIFEYVYVYVYTELEGGFFLVVFVSKVSRLS